MENKPNDHRIDVHSHFLPAKYLEMLGKSGGRVLGRPHDSTTLEKLVAGQDEAGISMQILSTGPHSPYLKDEAAALACARTVNDLYADVVAASAGRFAAFGSVPLPHVGPATREARRCLDNPGFAGIHLGCSVLGRPLDDPEFDEFWRELNDRKAIVFVHPGGVLMGEPILAGMNNPMIAVTIGSAAETATATLRLVVLRRRFPRIQFIIAILGGVLPFLYERIKRAAPMFGGDAYGKEAKRPLLDELREFYYDTTLDDDIDALIKARKVLGVERLVLGSDAPTKSPSEAIDFINEAGFSTAERDAIINRNANGLFSDYLASRNK